MQLEDLTDLINDQSKIYTAKRWLHPTKDIGRIYLHPFDHFTKVFLEIPTPDSDEYTELPHGLWTNFKLHVYINANQTISWIMTRRNQIIIEVLTDFEENLEGFTRNVLEVK